MELRMMLGRRLRDAMVAKAAMLGALMLLLVTLGMTWITLTVSKMRLRLIMRSCPTVEVMGKPTMLPKEVAILVDTRVADGAAWQEAAEGALKPMSRRRPQALEDVSRQQRARQALAVVVRYHRRALPAIGDKLLSEGATQLQTLQCKRRHSRQHRERHRRVQARRPHRE